jgi:hypothetical protein
MLKNECKTSEHTGRKKEKNKKTPTPQSFSCIKPPASLHSSTARDERTRRANAPVDATIPRSGSRKKCSAGRRKALRPRARVDRSIGTASNLLDIAFSGADLFASAAPLQHPPPEARQQQQQHCAVFPFLLF